MSDEFKVTFVMDLAPKEIWDALAVRRVEESVDGEVHYILPGFPSFVPQEAAGASCTVVELEAERLLRVKKDHEPCAGTEVVVTLEQEDTGTRVTVVQSGFGPFLDWAGRDVVFGHGNQIVTDFRLFLERGLTVPGTNWGANLGLRARQTPVGLETFAVDSGGVAESAGMQVGDLLLTLRGIRLHDTPQLWTVLALTEAGTTAELSWARGKEAMSGKATFPG